MFWKAITYLFAICLSKKGASPTPKYLKAARPNEITIIHHNAKRSLKTNNRYCSSTAPTYIEFRHNPSFAPIILGIANYVYEPWSTILQLHSQVVNSTKHTMSNRIINYPFHIISQSRQKIVVSHLRSSPTLLRQMQHSFYPVSFS